MTGILKIGLYLPNKNGGKEIMKKLISILLVAVLALAQQKLTSSKEVQQ